MPKDIQFEYMALSTLDVETLNELGELCWELRVVLPPHAILIRPRHTLRKCGAPDCPKRVCGEPYCKYGHHLEDDQGFCSPACRKITKDFT